MGVLLCVGRSSGLSNRKSFDVDGPNCTASVPHCIARRSSMYRTFLWGYTSVYIYNSVLLVLLVFIKYVAESHYRQRNGFLADPYVGVWGAGYQSHARQCVPYVGRLQFTCMIIIVTRAAHNRCSMFRFELKV